MGDLNIWMGLAVGILIGAFMAIMWLRSTWTSTSTYQEVADRYHHATQELALTYQKLEQKGGEMETLQSSLEEQKSILETLRGENRNLHQHFTRTEANLESVQTRLNEATEELGFKNQQISRLQEAIVDLRSEKSGLTAQNRSLQENQARQEEQIRQLNQKAHLEFEKIATEILKDRTKTFTESNKNNLDALLRPLSEHIEGFKKIIHDTHLQETKDRTALETKISELIKQTNQVSEQANNLATALKGQVKKQGNWGEMILESILEQSGLVKDRQYFLQATLKDPSGKQLRPDVLIKLPGSRTIIVDSKVSLLAYDRYVAATTKEQQQLALKEHLQSMYQHIDQLHSKNYDQLEESLDFTMLFVPIEPAYLLGIHEDPALWANAYSKRILLISPTNLIACLKLMDDLWKREMQSRSAMDIVRQGEKIYDKLIGFTESLTSVGDHLNKAQAVYQKAFNQMKAGRGNLIDQAIRLKSMGLKSSKTFSEELLNRNTADWTQDDTSLQLDNTPKSKTTMHPCDEDDNTTEIQSSDTERSNPIPGQ